MFNQSINWVGNVAWQYQPDYKGVNVFIISNKNRVVAVGDCKVTMAELKKKLGRGYKMSEDKDIKIVRTMTDLEILCKSIKGLNL